MAKNRKQSNPELDMTPMIDVVFLLIIFFIITASFTQRRNPDITLTPGAHGDLQLPDKTLTIEIDQRGWLSIQGAQLSFTDLKGLLARRQRVMGTFPILISGDARARHEHMQPIMDLCTDRGLRDIAFAVLHQD